MGTDTDDLEVFKVTPEQRRSIAKGLKAAKEGKVIPAKDADREIDAWFSE
jgi:predicted transcriptional regulator